MFNFLRNDFVPIPASLPARNRVILFVAVLIMTYAAGPRSAAPSCVLRVGICSQPNPGVTVTATSIDWLPPGGGNGCILTGAGTNVAYTGGGPLSSLPTPVQGTIKDLTAGGGTVL